MYEMRATVYGLQDIIWYNDFTATRDANNLWTGSESFQTLLANATGVLPEIGSFCTLDGWGFLKCTTIKVDNIEGDCALITVEYAAKGPKEGVDGGGGDTGTGGGDTGSGGTGGGDGGGTGGDGGSIDGSGSDLDKDFTYELGIITKEEPLETHHRYQKDIDVPLKEKQIIQDIKNGKLEKMNRNDELSFVFVPSSDPTGEQFTIESALGKELCSYILKGVDSYLYPAQIWRATYVDDKLPSGEILNSVGYITSAKGAPAISGNRSWLFNGLNILDQGGVYTITYEWQLSLPGGWETNIYNKPV